MIDARPLRSAADWRDTLLAMSREDSFSSATRATAAASGLPPKVDPWAPNPMASAAFGPASIAPTGKPPPSALAKVTTSGTT